ncbi:hypothetical protein ASPVEDRAFT_86091 [Aspergillus versicolor CBS 583.65]|uniref:Major facilitator superfamily (MFS) profile domain-containing protein n=1 Tax=Aspergillus versicolor CBS 583.65 TaxID=1036611 RepID=A0A1L9PT40_ASPVE|nr:uncharacterized protein ASPVEDRAFT_86091 [Aspergillus versicolor CBS 583.65]OJJ04708.1 hypothetical protein ASPVEDRAFT_86091 [Aspergillus versicolor CBS 583.65]
MNKRNSCTVSIPTDPVEISIDWSEEEEARARRKVDVVLLPCFVLAFFALQIDRANIASALTSTITEDLHITTNQINVGNQLLSLGIFLFEIPSNILLQRVGPRPWLSIQICAWSLVATFQAFIQSHGAFLATRLLLGIMEAGFIPGSLYYISSWYKKSEISVRVALFYLGQNFASATSSLLGAGLLTLDGRAGMAGWRWLFLVDGIISFVIGVLFVLFIPPHRGNGNPLVTFNRWSYFTTRESQILNDRVLLDDPTQAATGAMRISTRDIGHTIRRPRMWLHILVSVTSVCAVHSLMTYAPRIIKLSGFSTVQSNALFSVAPYLAMVINCSLAYLSDCSGHRGLLALVAASWLTVAAGFLTSLAHVSKWTRYVRLVMAGTPYSAIHALNVGWMLSKTTGPQDRSISSALIIMASNLGGIPSGQIFREGDAPLYHRAFSAVTALAGVAWVLTAVLSGYDLRRGRRREGGANC